MQVPKLVFAKVIQGERADGGKGCLEYLQTTTYHLGQVVGRAAKTDLNS